MNEAPVVELRSVSARLPTEAGLAPVISDVSLSINRSELVGLVGESGSGKSMTAKTILRALPPGSTIEGQVLVEGEDVTRFDMARLRELRRQRIAMILQDPRSSIDPLWSIGDYLTDGMRVLRGMSREAARARAIELLAEVGLRDGARRLHQYPGELSGGMLQRVAIACALAAEPAFLIADEATTGLDVTTQFEIVRLFVRLCRERQLGVLFITHDLALAAMICHRIGVMYAGRLVEFQERDGIFEHPRHPYTMGLLEARPDVHARREPGLPVIPGRPASAMHAPPGCPFHPRCPYMVDECKVVVPKLEIVGGAQVACLRADDIKEGRATRHELEARVG
jgi:oligopeptide/dipeptide ABC transporter ATP-binding protein